MSIFHQDAHVGFDDRAIELCNGQLVTNNSNNMKENEEEKAVVTREDSVMFLKNRPRGPYTTMRTLSNRKCIFQFGNHVQRLIDSSLVMMQQEKEIKQLSEQQVLFNTMHSMDGVPRAGNGYAIEALNDHAQLFSIMKHVLRESVLAYERAFLAEHAGHELKITVLICWDANNERFDVFSHVVDLMERPDRPVLADIRRGTRKDMKAKDSIWIEMRDAILDKKTKKSNEVIMCEDDGIVREGLSSNFFVIKDNFLVQTASEGILDGTVKQLIDKFAEEQSGSIKCDGETLRMVYSCPSLLELSQWRESFITSTSRLILPIYGFVIASDCIQFIDKQAAEKLQSLDNGDFYYPLLPVESSHISPRAQVLQDVLAQKLDEMCERIIE